ncbi:MAG: hypothetical protein ACNA7K_06165 [Acholeplasmataceae bacterium]
MNRAKKKQALFFIGAAVLLILFVLKWYVGLYYIVSVLIGLLVMIKLNDTDQFTFKYLIALLLLINIGIFGEFVLWSLDFTSYLIFFILPFAASYLTGLAYVLLRIYYPSKIK